MATYKYKRVSFDVRLTSQTGRYLCTCETQKKIDSFYFTDSEVYDWHNSNETKKRKYARIWLYKQYQVLR